MSGAQRLGRAGACRYAVHSATSQEHNTFHIIDRCIRYATGVEKPDKKGCQSLRCVPSVLDAIRTFQSTLLRREGALNADNTKAVHKAKGTELRMRARGQRARTLKARSGILRHLLHVMKT
eukprot:2418230-Pyramimonas_sp.AAC.1